VRATAFTVALAVAALASARALAGPPYVTDDPEPTDTGHWENYHFVMGAGREYESGLDLNYGGAKDLQLTAVIPIKTEDDWRSVGLGEIELAAKYRFLHQDEKGWMPDVAVFPNITLPTGPHATGHATFFFRFGRRRTSINGRCSAVAATPSIPALARKITGWGDWR
jgi:hypothetical protein